MFEGNQLSSSPAEYHPKVSVLVAASCYKACFSTAGTHQIEENINSPKYLDSLNENPVQSIQNLRLGRRFTFQQDNDTKHTARIAYRQLMWMSLSGPARAWAWTQSNISGETWKCASALIQPDRAWEVKSWGDKWQIIAKYWWAKLVASNKKKTWGCKGTSVSSVRSSASSSTQGYDILIQIKA